MIPWTWARWSESSNFAHVRRHNFAWHGPDDANNSFSYLSTRCCTDGSILLLSCTLTVGIKLHVVKLYKQNDLKWSLTRETNIAPPDIRHIPMQGINDSKRYTAVAGKWFQLASIWWIQNTEASFQSKSKQRQFERVCIYPQLYCGGHSDLSKIIYLLLRAGGRGGGGAISFL